MLWRGVEEEWSPEGGSDDECERPEAHGWAVGSVPATALRPTRPTTTPTASGLNAAEENQPTVIAVGVDAGGTSTVAALSKDGTYLRESTKPGANATTIGTDDAADIMITAVRDVLQGESPDAIYVGAAGAGRERVARELEEMLRIAFRDARVRAGDDAASMAARRQIVE